MVMEPDFQYYHKMTSVRKDEFQIVVRDTSNLWDQLCELLRIQGWTSQDLATTSLLREMPNVTSIFAVRKTDNLLLGSTIIVETDYVIFGNVYIIRNGYRASGFGMNMVKAFLGILNKSFEKKPFVARGVESMLPIYTGLPFLCEQQYMMYSFRLRSKEEAVEFFPPPEKHNYRITSIHDLSPRQFEEVVLYDRMVTGVDRSTFLRNYYSITLVKAVILYDRSGKVQGMASIVPTPVEPHLFKFNPLYAENKEAAPVLVKAITEQADDPQATFVLSYRTRSAGDWIHEKCLAAKKELYRVGVLINAMNKNQRYKDPSRTDLIYAPTNSAAHFDG